MSLGALVHQMTISPLVPLAHPIGFLASHPSTADPVSIHPVAFAPPPVPLAHSHEPLASHPSTAEPVSTHPVAFAQPPEPLAHSHEPLASHPSTAEPVSTHPVAFAPPPVSDVNVPALQPSTAEPVPAQPLGFTPPSVQPARISPPASHPLPGLKKSAPGNPFDNSLLAQFAQQPRVQYAQMAAEAANMVYQKSLQARAARGAAERAAQIASDHAAHAEGAAKMAASAIQHAQMDAAVLNAQALGYTAAAVGVPTPGDYSMAPTDLTSEPIIRSIPLDLLYIPPLVNYAKRPNECNSRNFF